ncbi:hypothetical protein ATO7_16394 [Oceanococcus atlanticus]|uniref:Uncharacterized protein n=1 Tax=Oceanococcus atlanticus TaxID=1317117 RepID=A0A1Y1S9W5_9GAMM|nr:hypothetical protein ATO7_16394 [Oceanococcus atlanticus]
MCLDLGSFQLQNAVIIFQRLTILTEQIRYADIPQFCIHDTEHLYMMRQSLIPIGVPNPAERHADPVFIALLIHRARKT